PTFAGANAAELHTSARNPERRGGNAAQMKATSEVLALDQFGQPSSSRDHAELSGGDLGLVRSDHVAVWRGRAVQECARRGPSRYHRARHRRSPTGTPRHLHAARAPVSPETGPARAHAAR